MFGCFSALPLMPLCNLITLCTLLRFSYLSLHERIFRYVRSRTYSCVFFLSFLSFKVGLGFQAISAAMLLFDRLSLVTPINCLFQPRFGFVYFLSRTDSH